MATLGTPLEAYAEFNERSVEDVYQDSGDVKLLRDNNGNAIYFSRAPIPYFRGSGGAYDAAKSQANLTVGSMSTNSSGAIHGGGNSTVKGDLQTALIDGYLRTIVLFEQVKDVQPEALYKAVKCFEDLGQAAHADKMRKKLLAEYPQTAYAKWIQAGS